MNFAPTWRRVVKHIDTADAVDEAAIETRSSKLRKTATRWTAAAVLIAGLQTGLILLTRQPSTPPTIVVRLPGGSSVTVTPPATPTAAPTGGSQP